MTAIKINGIMVNEDVPAEFEEWYTDCNGIVKAIADCTDDLTLKINSYGGSVEGGTAISIALADWTQAHAENKAKVEIGAVCASAAANLVARLPKSVAILVHPESMIMYHSCSALIEGSPDELRDNADRMDKINDIVKDALHKRTTLDASKVDEWFLAGREGWLSGFDAVACGLADGYINSDFEPAPIIENIDKYKNTAIAAIMQKCKELHAMEEEKKEVIETEVEKIEEAPTTEIETDVEEPKEVETEVEKEVEKVDAECDKEIEALKAENEALKAEVAELKATCEKLTAGLKAPTAKAETKKTFAEMVKAIPTDISDREYARRFTALKEEHKAEYKAYMDAHQRH